MRRLPECFHNRSHRLLTADGNPWLEIPEYCLGVTFKSLRHGNLIIEDLTVAEHILKQRGRLYDIKKERARVFFRFYKNGTLLYTIATDGKMYDWSSNPPLITEHELNLDIKREDVEGCPFCGIISCNGRCQRANNYHLYMFQMYGIDND